MRAILSAFIGLVVLVSACGEDSTAPTPTSVTTTAIADPDDPSSPWPVPPSGTHHQWLVRIVDRLPHDHTAFTQGLELTDSGVIESTGLRGESTLRVVDPTTGAVTATRALEESLFGEGLTLAGDEIVQLTWTAGIALRYDADTLDPVGEFRFDGEGWGLCASDSGFWMSNGGSELTLRNRATFAPIESVTVHRGGSAVTDLNELECIGDHVVANVWKSNEILVIDPTTGAVAATIDASALADEIAPADKGAVLNGIADLGNGTLLLGGKLWPTFFVVEIVAN